MAPSPVRAIRPRRAGLEFNPPTHAATPGGSGAPCPRRSDRGAGQAIINIGQRLTFCFLPIRPRPSDGPGSAELRVSSCREGKAGPQAVARARADHLKPEYMTAGPLCSAPIGSQGPLPLACSPGHGPASRPIPGVHSSYNPSTPLGQIGLGQTSTQDQHYCTPAARLC